MLANLPAGETATAREREHDATAPQTPSDTVRERNLPPKRELPQKEPRLVPAIPWRDRLSTHTVFTLLLIFIAIVGALVAVIQTYGRNLVLAESERRIEANGNLRVEELSTRLREIAALVRTMGASATKLPKSNEWVKDFFEEILNFQGDPGVAGGGFWPEPFRFDPDIARRSFFWGQDSADANKRAYIDKYNLPPPEPGYHNEEWYVVARHAKPGGVFWSKSYVDTYSHEPMVTCTGNVFENKEFTGVVTIDLKLAGLDQTIDRWAKEGGGYAFILDRNNKFLAFPDKAAVTKEVNKNETDQIFVEEYAKNQPAYSAIDLALKKLDESIVSQAKNSGRFGWEIAARVDSDSYQINQQEAEFIAAVLADPLAATRQKTYLQKTVELPKDPILKEPAVASIFVVPESYWKVILVTPLSEATSVADKLSSFIVAFAAGFVLLILIIAFAAINKNVVQPIQQLSGAMDKVSSGDLAARVSISNTDEIGHLALGFNEMVTRLHQTRGELQNALTRREAQTNQILETVNEGLCLIGPDYVIQPQYSAALERIVERENLGGINVLDLFKPLVSERVLNSTKDYIDILFADEVSQKLIRSINPVTEVEFSFEQPENGGGVRVKHLSFNFERVREANAVTYVMLAAQDVSARVSLARRLAQAEASTRLQVELVMNIVHVAPTALRDFLSSVTTDLKAIDATLKKPEQILTGDRQPIYRATLDDLFRKVHSIKGNSALLKLELFEKAAHRIEDKIAIAKSLKILSGESFLPVVLELTNLQKLLDDTVALISKFRDLSEPAKDESGRISFGPGLASALSEFATNQAVEVQKEVVFHAQGLDDLAIPFAAQKSVQDSMIQFVRNAVVHGVETPAERERLGKPRKGQLSLYALRQTGLQYLVLRDDGRGMDLEKIRAQAKALGLPVADTDADLNLIFQPGFSTHDEVTPQAGRGIGLDLVREKITELGGTVMVQSAPGIHSDFYIVFPEMTEEK